MAEPTIVSVLFLGPLLPPPNNCYYFQNYCDLNTSKTCIWFTWGVVWVHPKQIKYLIFSHIITLFSNVLCHAPWQTLVWNMPGLGVSKYMRTLNSFVKNTGPGRNKNIYTIWGWNGLTFHHSHSFAISHRSMWVVPIVAVQMYKLYGVN